MVRKLSFLKKIRFSLLIGLLISIKSTSVSSNNDQLYLNGQVPQQCLIYVFPLEESVNLVLDQLYRLFEIAQVWIYSNSESGHQVYVQSVNNGQLINSLGKEARATPFGYELYYGDKKIQLSDHPTLIEDISGGKIYFQRSPIKLSLDGRPFADSVSGIYYDHVYFSIVGR